MAQYEYLLDEFDLQWTKFLKHNYITAEQFEYIQKPNEESNELDAVVIQIDFAENYNRINQHTIMQSH